jgi:hypothetical protein
MYQFKIRNTNKNKEAMRGAAAAPEHRARRLTGCMLDRPPPCRR